MVQKMLFLVLIGSVCAVKNPSSGRRSAVQIDLQEIGGELRHHREHDDWSFKGMWDAAKDTVGKVAGAAAGWLISKLPANVRDDIAKLIGTIDTCFFAGDGGCSYGKDVPFFVHAGATCGGGGDLLDQIKAPWHTFVPEVRKMLDGKGAILRELKDMHERGILSVETIADMLGGLLKKALGGKAQAIPNGCFRAIGEIPMMTDMWKGLASMIKNSIDIGTLPDFLELVQKGMQKSELREHWLESVRNAVKKAGDVVKGGVGNLVKAGAGFVIKKIPQGAREKMVQVIDIIDSCVFGQGNCKLGPIVPAAVRAGATCSGSSEFIDRFKVVWHKFAPEVKSMLQALFLREDARAFGSALSAGIVSAEYIAKMLAGALKGLLGNVAKKIPAGCLKAVGSIPPFKDAWKKLAGLIPSNIADLGDLSSFLDKVQSQLQGGGLHEDAGFKQVLRALDSKEAA